MSNDKRSYTEYTVTQPTTDFVIGFEDYDDITKDNILVTVNGVLAEAQGYAVLRKSAQVVTVTPPISNATVRLQRETAIDSSFHKFTAGALFSAKSMDENFEQIRHSQQEVRDGFTFLEFNTNGIVEAAKVATTAALVAAEDVQEATSQANNAASDANLAAGASRAATVDTVAATQASNSAASAASVATQAANTATTSALAVVSNVELLLPELDVALGASQQATNRANTAADIVESVFLDELQTTNVFDVTGISQDTLNNGLASIAELVAIPAPTNGMRVYVKSYHAALNRGGGYFIYDSSKSAINDDGLVINGWVREEIKTVSLDDFGAVGGDAVKDTAALKKAILSCKQGGVFAGKAIRVPAKTYLISEIITIDAPVNIFGLSSGANSDGMQAPILKFISTSGFNFVDGAGYCHFKDLRLVGTKKGGLDIPNSVFGNYGMQFTQGAFGMFENIRIEFFDVGRTAVKGAVWAGAYRFYNYCKFRDNTYNVVQQGYSTDENFFQCDFRASEASKAGYIYIDARGHEYQTTNFIDCMFELLGNSELVSGKRVYSQFGMQIYGKSIVKITGGYSEMCPTFVDKGASLVSTANIVGTSESLIHTGGGLINLDGAFARSNEYLIPDFSDTTYWDLGGITYDGLDVKDGIIGHKFTITAGAYHVLEAKDFNAYRKASMNTIPLNPERILALVELEYQAPVDKTIIATFDSYAVDTWSDSKYYDNTAAWRRKVYTAPIALTESSGVRNTERVRISFPDAVAGATYFIRQCAFKILAE